MKLRIQSLTLFSVIAVSVGFCRAESAPVAESGELTEATITRATANLLERGQFSERLVDARLSSHFLDCYLDTLDGAHLLFLKCDIDEFVRFRSDLAQMTLLEGETRPAHIMYARYLKRLAQQVDFETFVLHSAKFNFTGDDSWQADRREAPPPLDLAAAKRLWREEVREDYLREKLAGTPVVEIAPMLARRYEGLLQTMRRLKADEVLGIYLDSLAHAYDPHSDYFRREEWENFKIEMNLSLVGVGATVQAKNGYCVITDLVPGSPAALSGVLKPGDRIVAVAQGDGEPVDIVDMPPSQAADLLRGPKGSTVCLTVIPAGAGNSTRKAVSLVREEIDLTNEHASAAIIDLPQKGSSQLRIGVIVLPAFYGTGDEKTGASADTARLIKRLKKEGVLGLILDLRHNAGGALEEAVWLTGLFVPSEPVVQTRGPMGDEEIDTSPETNALYDGPLVVLTSRLSASASEIVAGALQDYGRALIVGDSSTFGKGTVQTIVPLKAFLHRRGLGAVKVTMRKFYRPSGASTQLKGVMPDIVLPSETDLADIGEATLPNALPWDLMPPTTYAKFDLPAPVLAAVREKSQARVAADPGFRLMREQMAMANKDQQANSLSLNEASRRREKARIDEIRAEMNKVLLDKEARRQPTYNVSLAEVDSVGLLPDSNAAPLAAEASRRSENQPRRGH